MDKEKLSKFIYDTNAAGYASGDSFNWEKQEDGSTKIVHEDGDWRSVDIFYGGEPYGGNEVVFHGGKAEWMMVYWGEVEKGVNSKEVYKVLQEALREMPEDAPFRGPREHTMGEWQYKNSWEGKVDKFKGEETIHNGERQVYWAGYMGGLVDQE
jgi:hypothetical protein